MMGNPKLRTGLLQREQNRYDSSRNSKPQIKGIPDKWICERSKKIPKNDH